MIHITGLVFRYPQGDFRLSIPEMSVPAGAAVAMVGPSGSGKTTLLHLVAGILIGSPGQVITNNIDVAVLGERARREFRIRQVGLMFQEFELLEHLHVLDNILLPCRISPAVPLRSGHRQRAARLAAELGIDDKLSRSVRTLSQGERQRVALCRALLLQPPLLLCDEPTSHLDPITKDRVLEVLFTRIRRVNTTLLAITHDHELLPRFDETIDFRQFHP